MVLSIIGDGYHWLQTKRLFKLLDSGYSTLWSLTFASPKVQQATRASERARAPVILSLDETHLRDLDFELAIAASERAADRADVPVAI
jgi:hypothetical protein